MSPLRTAAVVAGLGLASGCGDDASDYEREAAALCRSFNERAFAAQVDAGTAAALYGELGDGFARLSPPDDLRRTHDVMAGFARAGEATFADVSQPGTAEPDLRLSVGAWEEDVVEVRRVLPDCADSLTGTDRDPDVEVDP